MIKSLFNSEVRNGELKFSAKKIQNGDDEVVNILSLFDRIDKMKGTHKNE